jgi:hypothetical protein
MSSFFGAADEPTIGKLDTDSNLIMAWAGGTAVMIFGSVLWGLITYYAEGQYKLMAIGVGFLVGFAVKYFGKGETVTFGITGAVLSLLGCILGNFLYYAGLMAHQEEIPLMNALLLLLDTPAAILEFFTNVFNIRDVFLYAVAAYIGYKTALDISKHE